MYTNNCQSNNRWSEWTSPIAQKKKKKKKKDDDDDEKKSIRMNKSSRPLKFTMGHQTESCAKGRKRVRVISSSHDCDQDNNRKKSILDDIENNNDNVKRKKFKQVFLDFGQKNFERKICEKCEMIYAPGVESDEKQHKKFCQTQSINFGLVSSRSLVNKKTALIDCFNLGNDKKGSIFKWKMNDKTALYDQILMFKSKIVDVEMGFHIEESPNTKSNKTLFACLVERKIVGLLVCEPLDIRQHKTVIISGEDGLLTYPKLGILQIWVDGEFRRKKVASTLIDTARVHFFSDYNVSKREVAFSQPTIQGKKLLEHYVGNNTNTYQLI